MCLRLSFLLVLGFTFLSLPGQRGPGIETNHGSWNYFSQDHIFHIHVDTTLVERREDYDVTDYAIPQIDILSRNPIRYIQSIFPAEAHSISTVYDSSLAIKIVDANFDGFLDLEVRDTPMMYLSTSHYWLYNPKTEMFLADTFLADLTDITYMPEQGLVHSYYHIGPNEFGHSLWEWQDGLLKCVARETVATWVGEGEDIGYSLEIADGEQFREIDLPCPYEYDIPRGEEMALHRRYLKYKSP